MLTHSVLKCVSSRPVKKTRSSVLHVYRQESTVYPTRPISFRRSKYTDRGTVPTGPPTRFDSNGQSRGRGPERSFRNSPFNLKSALIKGSVVHKIFCPSPSKVREIRRVTVKAASVNQFVSLEWIMFPLLYPGQRDAFLVFS